MSLRHRYKSPANGVLLEIQHTVDELLFGHDLAFVEAAHPHVQPAFQAEGKASLNELHGFFERNIRSGRDQSVEMVRHDDQRVQLEPPLTAIVEDGSKQQLRGSRDLEKTATLRRHSGDEIRPRFLWRSPRWSSRNERPAAKAALAASLNSGA
jgi:hypothetical protein